MTTVVLGDDGSDLARHAAESALRLLGPDPEAVLVVRVVPPVVPIVGAPAAGLGPPIASAALDEATEAARENAEVETARTARSIGPGARSHVVVGEPGPALCRVAAEVGADVLVVGSHGSGFLRRVLLGSVSHHVAHHAPCPVLVVRGAREGVAGDGGGR